MIKSVLVDDDKKNLTVLRALLNEVNADVEVVGEADNAKDASRLIPEIKPDLVFLDIEMPFGNAFDLLDKLSPVDFEVVFITAFSNYTLKAFRYSALDYLLKPVDIDELRAAVIKAEAKVSLKTINDQLSTLFYNLNKPVAAATRIAMPVNDGFDFIDINEIVQCESKNNCTIISTGSGKKYICTRTIGDYQELLPQETFFRIHHSFIVNVNHIRKFFKEGRGGYIELANGALIPVAYRRKDHFLGKFGYNREHVRSRNAEP